MRQRSRVEQRAIRQRGARGDAVPASPPPLPQVLEGVRRTVRRLAFGS